VAAFNRGSLDVPSNLFTSRTTFSLNNRSYESILGGSADDPLIRLLARGVAGYRTAAKALQYSLPGACISVESLSEPDETGARSASIRVDGQLRHAGAPFTARAQIRFACAGDTLTSVEVSCSEGDLAQIAAERR